MSKKKKVWKEKSYAWKKGGKPGENSVKMCENKWIN